MSCSKWGRWVIFKVKLSNFEVLSKYDQVFLKLYLMSGLKDWVQSTVWIFKGNLHFAQSRLL